MEQFLADLESSLGVPAALIERAAAARAGAIDSTAEAVVRAWAGAGDAPAAAAPQPVVEAAAAAAAVESTPATESEAAAAPDAAASAAAVPASAAAPEAPALAVEVLEAAEPTPQSESASVDAAEPAGVLAGFPSWLAAAVLFIPVLALAYVMIAPNGPGCGTSGQLAIDAETGLAENCDGTQYGVESTSFFTIGRDIYEGPGRCVGCHSTDGSGGSGPAFAGGAVLVAFPEDACSEHVRWVSTGTDDWPEPTYGANGTAVGSSGASMPGFADILRPDQLAAVVIYERVQFGGQSLADAEADCGVEELEFAGGE